MSESKKVVETKLEKKVEEPKVDLRDNAHVDFTIVGNRVLMSYDKKAKKDVMFINDKEVVPTYNRILEVVRNNQEAARRITLYAANEYVIRGYSREDVLCGIAK